MLKEGFPLYVSQPFLDGRELLSLWGEACGDVAEVEDLPFDEGVIELVKGVVD